MVNRLMRRLALATVGSLGLAGCTLPPPQLTSTSMSSTSTTIGSLEPVYNPPPNTPFRCVGAGATVIVDRIPGDTVDAPLTETTSPVFTTGNRRGDWLLVVTRAGTIGWIDDPHEQSFSEEYPGAWCHVDQNAEGALVFKFGGGPSQGSM